LTGTAKYGSGLLIKHVLLLMFQIPGFLEEPQFLGRLETVKVDMKPIKTESEGGVPKIPQILYK
jgi:hypothetical protein